MSLNKYNYFDKKNSTSRSPAPSALLVRGKEKQIILCIHLENIRLPAYILHTGQESLRACELPFKTYYIDALIGRGLSKWNNKYFFLNHKRKGFLLRNWRNIKSSRPHSKLTLRLMWHDLSKIACTPKSSHRFLLPARTERCCSSWSQWCAQITFWHASFPRTRSMRFWRDPEMVFV